MPSLDCISVQRGLHSPYLRPIYLRTPTSSLEMFSSVRTFARPHLRSRRLRSSARKTASSTFARPYLRLRRLRLFAPSQDRIFDQRSRLRHDFSPRPKLCFTFLSSLAPSNFPLARRLTFVGFALCTFDRRPKLFYFLASFPSRSLFLQSQALFLDLSPFSDELYFFPFHGHTFPQHMY